MRRSVVAKLTIADLEVDAEAPLRRQVTGCLDQLGRQVLARGPGTGTCRAEGDGAGASGEIEPVLPRSGAEPSDQLIVHREELALRDVLPGGRSPDPRLISLERRERCHVRRASSETLVTPYFWVALSARSETKRYSVLLRQVSISKPAASIAAR